MLCYVCVVGICEDYVCVDVLFVVMVVLDDICVFVCGGVKVLYIV